MAMTAPTQRGPDTDPQEVASPGRPRLAHLDVVRVGLTLLVVAHHVAMVYGAAGLGFYFVDLPPEIVSRGLLIFVLTNQAWFMGAFFLVAGYFTPASFDRKGATPFLRSRVIRLGIPLAVFVVILNPVAVTGWFFVHDLLGPLTWDTYEYTDYLRMGPTWFLALLLIFSLGYAAWRQFVGEQRAAWVLPGAATIAAFVVALAATSFVWRMYIEVGEEKWGFPSLAYLPQYASLFVVGAVAARSEWFDRLPGRTAIAGFVAAVGAWILLFPLAFSGEMFSLELTESVSRAFGGGTWRSAVYAVWDATLAVGLVLALIVGLRTLVRSQGTVTRFLAQHSLTVYLLHIPVIVYVAVAFRDIDISRPLKILIVGVVATAISFALAWAIRRIPGARRVL